MPPKDLPMNGSLVLTGRTGRLDPHQLFNFPPSALVINWTGPSKRGFCQELEHLVINWTGPSERILSRAGVFSDKLDRTMSERILSRAGVFSHQQMGFDL